MFRLSTSAIVRVISVHTKNEKLEVSSKKQKCKVVIVTKIIPYKRSNYIKNVSATSQYNPMYLIKHKTGM